MAGNWSIEKTEELLAYYEEEEVLWKITRSDYHKKEVRQAALIRVSEKLRMSVAEISKKITNLRTYYNKELSKEKKSRVSGSGTDEIYRSKWPFYETINSFLRDQVLPRKAMSNMDADSDHADETDDENADPEIEDGNDSQTSNSTRVSQELTRSSVKRKATERLIMSKKKQNSTDDDLIREASSMLKTLSYPKTVKEDDCDDVYGKFIANEMRQITDIRTKQFIKYKIQGLLFEAQCGNRYAAGLNTVSGPSSTNVHGPNNGGSQSAFQTHRTSTPNPPAFNEQHSFY